MHDPMPRVVLVPGLGLFGLGASAKDARIAADIAQAAVEGITDAEAIGRFTSISRSRHVRLRILAAGTRQARRAQGVAARRPGRRHHRRRRRHRRGHRRAFAEAGAEVALLDHRCRRGAGKSASDRRRGASRLPATSPMRLGARRLRRGGRRLRRRRYRRVECRRRLAGQDRRGRRGDLARRASN